MSTIVTLPSNFSFSSMYGFTGAVVGPNGFPLDHEFVFDFKRLSFIEGSGLTVFCNTLEWLFSHNVKVYFLNHLDIYRGAITYLDDCGFFQRYIGQNLRPNAAIRGTTLPFTRVSHAEAHGWLEFKFTPWMSWVLGAEHGALASVRTCIKEVFNNINDHSTQSIGFIHVQHYPKVNRVTTTISDFGRGIPANIQAQFPMLDDGAAILKATTRGFTTKSNPRNMGVGLDFLIDNVTGNGGNVSIYSFRGAVSCYRDGAGVVHRYPSQGNGSYPGTLVELSLRTDCFVGDDAEEEEMKW